ncbi:hypothetical protein [Streptomyces sp. t39]|uniref:hypothetical protein n=1 Tax=Streptomyces sp. t39 TaxID=1828156 RepID=UPI0011CE87C9|nr:hypothetical protein [Streptomyces sp. t39]TXS35265.1 hypothetical protein EAO77_37240 [Streptomyces sp. t39]
MSDDFRVSAPVNEPVRCLKCLSQAVIMSKAHDARRDELRWRYRCLDCGVAWWVDEHGGHPDEYRSYP